MNSFDYLLSSWLGTAFYSICIFMLGAWIGRPLCCWLNNKMPWKDCGDNCGSCK